MSTIFRIIYEYRQGLITGLCQTLSLAIIVWTVGIISGILIGVMAHKDKTKVGTLLKITSFLMASIPVLVLLFWLHYPLQAMLNIVIHPYITAAVTLSLINTVSVAQMVKVVLDDFPTQYRIAGKVCGMTERECFKHIEFPIISRQLIPVLLTQQVTMLQMTLFASLISVEEIFRVVQQINSLVYKPIEIYTALALFFILLCLPINGAAYFLKKKYTRQLSES
jgi:His/Glu/Gln/Arg/opine family amino acid ABC transporter permease subunit